MKLVQSILEKVSATKPDPTVLDKPSFNRKENEKVIGDLTPELQSFFTVVRQTEVEFEKAMAESQEKVMGMTLKGRPVVEIETALDAIEEKLAPAIIEKDLTTKMFWATVRTEIPGVAIVSRIAIRKGWEIVSVPEDNSRSGVTVINMGVPGGLFD